MSKTKHYINKIKITLTENLSKFRLTIPISIILGSVIISISIISYGFIVSSGTDIKQDTTFKGRAVDATDYVEGNVDSKIVALQYSDPECPFCVKLDPTMKDIRIKYSDKVAFVYRHFPLSIHKNALDESRAIACAGKIGGTKSFYEYIDVLYGNKFNTQNPATLSFIPLTQNGKELIAESIGLNMVKFSACMASGETKDLVINSINDGVQAGVQGTPSTFILIKNKNGYDIASVVDGARDKSFFEAAIEDALSR